MQAKNLTISLIIPAFNEEKYIAASLTKIVTNPNNRFHEIIVVDNDSTDTTRDVVARFPQVKLVLEKKRSPTHARERGFREATGDIVAYIDADTHITSDWYTAVLDFFNRREDIVCVSGPVFYYDVSMVHRIATYLYWYVLAFPVYYLVGYMAVGGNFAIRRSTLEEMNGFDTNIHFYGDDTNLARRARKVGRVKFSSRLLLDTSGRRIHEQGLIATAVLYIKNFLSEVFLQKPHTHTYDNIR